ncbi:xylitol dehydrogenase [Cystobasidium minutum MCA 4210]|uniref:xylitol dehydrogenase n=1 Tax=Cystobasidium minutum MCA 4210 TaxID=1397322 RepID=UPI0034CF03F8|eukprot:jgi/Rhomi1/170859/fgenesh1_kg.4_\
MSDNQFPKKNVAFVLNKVDEVSFEERPLPDPKDLGPDEVLIAPKSTGICGSDVHYWKHGKIGDFVVKAPMILGHETAGIVYAVGSNVSHLKKGDRVALEPGQMCRHCEICKEGCYELCKDMVFAATPPYDGTLAGYYKLSSDLCYKLTDNISIEEGALFEPLAVAVQAVAKVADLHANKNVAIFGAGPVGLMCMAVAKALGSRRVIAIDIQDERLNFAKSYAATDIWKSTAPKENESKMDYARRQSVEMSEKLNIDLGQGDEAIDLVVDCTGAEVCIATGMFLAKDGGTYVQVGMGSENVTIPITHALTKMLNWKGSFRYGAGVYKLALGLVAQGKIELKPLITHRYKFNQAKEAFQCMVDNKGYDGKPPIKCIISGPEE